MDANALPPRPSLAQYRKQAKDLLRDARDDDPQAMTRLAECPRVRRMHASRTDTSRRAEYALADAQFVIAREHGFVSWHDFAEHVAAMELAGTPAARFEAAADAVVNGDEVLLRDLLRTDPELARARSARAHHVTLLHYSSANGVEDFRQRSPANAVAIARALLDAGAEVDATADSYGGGPWQTPLNLIVSSVHPARAGVQVPLVDALVDGGAAVNGVTDDGSPLLTALAFQYPDAARALVRRGARVDTLAAAAGLGDEALVRSFLAGGAARRSVERATPRWLELSPGTGAERDRALIWAATFGHRVIVELLSDAGASLGASDAQEMTALHWAAWMGHLSVVDTLIARGASLEATNRYGGTVLGATVWAAVHGGRALGDAGDRRDGLALVDYASVVEHLLAASARIDAVSYPSGHAGVDAVLARRGHPSAARPV